MRMETQYTTPRGALSSYAYGGSFRENFEQPKNISLASLQPKNISLNVFLPSSAKQ